MCCIIKVLFERLRRNENFQNAQEIIILLTPLCITTFLQYSINITPIIFIGQVGRVQLDGVSFAISVIHIFGTSVGYGLSYACDALFSQAFGSNDKKKTGFYLQKSIYISLLFPFPIAAALLNIDHLLLLFRQDPRICKICSIYIATYLPALPIQYLFFILSRYMQNQDKMWPALVSSLIGNAFNILSQYLVIFVFHYEYQASAVCMFLTYSIMVVFNISYLLISKFHVPTWPGWTIRALYDWKTFLKFAIPGIGYTTFEQINWEAQIFMSGLMGIVPMAVHSVLSQTGSITSAIYMSMGITVNVKIGQNLGANKPEKVKKVVKISVILIIVFSFIISFPIAIANSEWPKIFSSDELVQSEVSKLVKFFPVYFFPEAINMVLAGILRGYSKHTLVMIFAFGTMYSTGMPLSAVLGFLTPLQVAGLWIGNCVGLFLIVIIFSITTAYYTYNNRFLNVGNLHHSEYYKDNHQMEEESSLIDHQERDEFHSELGEYQHQTKHSRIPSHGNKYSSDLSQLRKSMKHESIKENTKSDQDQKSIVLKRIVTLIICILILIIGISTHFAFRPDYSIYETPTTSPLINITTLSFY